MIMNVEQMLKDGGLSARRAKSHAEGVEKSLKQHLEKEEHIEKEKKPKSKKVVESKDVTEPENDYKK